MSPHKSNCNKRGILVECKKISLETVDSTNEYAKAHIHDFDPNTLTLITAKEQTKGRGRFNRPWYSPKDKNIYATFAFRLDKNTKHISALSHLLALSFSLVLRDKGLCPQLKWPNDIYLNEKKMGGVLSEIFFHDEHIDCILGIGINVNLQKEDMSHIDTLATSMHLETSATFEIEPLITELEKSFCKNLEVFKKEGFYPFHNEYESLLLYKGESVTIETDGKIVKGLLHSTSVEGTLNLCTDNKEMISITSGTLRKA